MAKKKQAKKAASEIKVGTATKYKDVKFSAERVIALYKDGKNVSEIAIACGYKKNTGHNRTRRVLVAAGLYKRSA